MTEGNRLRLTMAACVAAITGMLASCDDSGPALTGTPAKTAIVGESYRFQPMAVNVSGGRPVMFAIANKPAWISFDSSTGQLSGTPTASQVGVFPNIQISLVTGMAHVSLPAFSITVVTPPTASAANGVPIFWQAPTENTDGSVLSNLKGYKIYYGGASGQYSTSIDIPNPGLTSYVVQNLTAGQYYFAVTSYNSAGVESGYSSEVSTALN